MFFPIKAPYFGDSVLFAAFLKAIEETKKDFDIFSTNNNIKISTKKAFIKHNLDFNEIDKIDFNHED